jgi:peptide/nickel transport system substrate-binding protein
MTGLFFSKRILLLVGLMALIAVFAACSGDDDDTTTAPPAAVPTSAPVQGLTGNLTTPDATAAPAATAMPVMATVPKTKRVVLGLIPPAVLSNSFIGIGSTSAFQLKPMYEYLMDTDPNTRQLIPGLAKSWSIEPGGAGLRFFLEENVPFHDSDGNEAGFMTADDVAWTREDIIVEDSSNSIRALMRSAEVTIVNDHEIVFQWEQPDADALDFIGNQVGGMEISSRADAATLDIPIQRRPINGTGPYVFTSRSQDQNIVFTKIQGEHWRIPGDFEEIEMRWLSESSTRLAALLAGETHITLIPFDSEERALSDGMKVVTGKVNTMRTYMQFNGVYLKDAKDPSSGYMYPDSPLMDKKVRQALNKAIDRDAINTAFFFDLATKMTAIHVAESHGAFNPRWNTEFEAKYGYDPAAAKALLAEAGYNANNPLKHNTFVLDVTQYSGGPDVVESIAGYWSEIGVDVNLVTMDRAQRSALQRGLELDNHSALGVLIAPPILALRLGHHTSSPRGGGAESYTVEASFEKARRTLDLVEQNKFLQASTDDIYDSFMAIPLYWVPVHAVVNPDVVEDWIFPGTVSGTWTHFWNIIGTR